MSRPTPIRPRRLVTHARELADHRPGRPGRPHVVRLRRSASAAYYAVFHGVALAVTDQVGSGLPPTDRVRLARSVDHAKVADVCRWLASPSPAGKEHVRPIVGELQADPDVVELADIFVRLQEARHEADYDHLGVFGKLPVLGLVTQAERALDLVDGLVASINGRRFLTLIGMHTQLR